MQFTTFLIVLFGFVGVGRSAIGYLYLLELIPSEWKNLTSSLTHATNSFTFVFSALYFWKWSKDWQGFFIFALVSNIITVIAVSIIPESPKFTFANKQYQRTRTILNQMAKYNKTNKEYMLAETDKFTQEIRDSIPATKKNDKANQGKSKEGSLINLIKNRKLLRNLIISTTLMVTCQFNYFLICFNIKYMPGIIFLSQIICASCEMAFLFISNPFIKYLGLKRSFFVGYGISLLGSVPLIFETNSNVLPVLLILLARVGIIFVVNVTYLTFSTLFPPIFSQTTFGFAKLIGRVFVVLAPLVAELAAPAPMIFFTFFSIVGGVFAFFIIQSN